MPPKGGNGKKESGRAKKAENEVKKKEAAAVEKERQEAVKWSEGSKADKAAEARAKQEAAAARKAEAARLLAEEEAAATMSKPKVPKTKAPAKKSTLPTPAPEVAEVTVTGKGKGRAIETDTGAGSGSGAGAGAGSSDQDLNEVVHSFSASNLDDALDLLEVVNAKTDKSSVGNMASEIERHPERRFKGAYEAYVERELPELRKDYPGLRLQQYKDMLYKNFQKSPENPFNQTTVSFNASKEEKVEALKRRQEEIENRLREKKGTGIGSP